MRLLIVRHGDPDYEHDSLTERGWQEAELLSQKLSKIPVDAWYVSCLGRAKDTASLTLQKVGAEAQVCDWLQEFRPKARRPHDGGKESLAWDWLPADWTAHDELYDPEHWYDREEFAPETKEEYEMICRKFDEVLEQHGYRRKGRLYEVLQSNEKTLVFFCHFGLECVLLSHLMNVSPMVLWHTTCAAPTSVTTVITEERRQGVAQFRINGFGDVSHLYAGGMEPAFAARWCERFENTDQRH